MNISIKLDNEHILKDFPEFDYKHPKHPVLTDFWVNNNVVGNQQRCFVIWSILRELKKRGPKVGISVACGQIIEPFCIGIDKYCGDNHPVYGGKYIPHLTQDCHKLPFNDNMFGFIVANHAIEHMEDPIDAFGEWVRVLEPNGALILIVPDKRYEPFQKWDLDHKQFFAPQSFQEKILVKFNDKLYTEFFDDLINHY